MSNPMEQFEIKPLIPLNIGGVDVSFTNSSLFMVLAVVSAVLLMGICLRKRTIIPSVAQSVPEVLYEFIAGLLRENVGMEGMKYFSFIFKPVYVCGFRKRIGAFPLCVYVYFPFGGGGRFVGYCAFV